MSVVLVTGPTAGIGKSLAYKFAERGYDLFLVARRLDRLKEIALDIEKKFNVNVEVLQSDLKNKNSPKEIYDYSRKTKLDVEILVLNAGYQHNKTLHEVSLDDEEDCLRVLGLSVIMQTKLYLKDFIKKRRWKSTSCFISCRVCTSFTKICCTLWSCKNIYE